MKPIPTETATDVGSVGKWLGAAAAGAVLMYLLDPERGSARRSRAVSALRAAGARTGASVDHALHSAGERIASLGGSAAGALSRGADRVQSRAAPVLERVQHGAHETGSRLHEGADRMRARFGQDRADANRDESSRYESGRYESSRYESSHDDDAGHRARGGIGQWLQGLFGSRERGDGRASSAYEDSAASQALVGGGLLGLLSLMRRSPGGLLVGLAGLALLMKASGSRSYRVTDNIALGKPRTRPAGEQAGAGAADGAPHLPQSAQPGSRYLH